MSTAYVIFLIVIICKRQIMSLLHELWSKHFYFTNGTIFQPLQYVVPYWIIPSVFSVVNTHAFIIWFYFTIIPFVFRLCNVYNIHNFYVPTELLIFCNRFFLLSFMKQTMYTFLRVRLLNIMYLIFLIICVKCWNDSVCSVLL